MTAPLILTLAADHPVGDGHFPGNPIVPGALLLAQAIKALTLATGKTDMNCDIKAAKFLHPVRPGEPVTLDWSLQANGTIAFTGTIQDGTRVMTGSVGFGDASC